MKTIVFFIEGKAEREMLNGLLSNVIPRDKGINIRYQTFQGKQDLEKNLVRRLRHWNLPDSAFVIMRDQDFEDCQVVKQGLVDLCQKSDKDNFLVRIACRELESFYLGDLKAVEEGLGIKGIAKQQRRKEFRNPDMIHKPSKKLKHLTDDRYHKVQGSRDIAPHLSLVGNYSHSFTVLIEGIQDIVKGTSR